jgi:hypothetical protein
MTEGHTYRCTRLPLGGVDLLGRPAIEQYILQPPLHRRRNCVDVGERHLAGEAGGDVGGEADLGSKRLGRPWFDPGADDQEACVI